MKSLLILAAVLLGFSASSSFAQMEGLTPIEREVAETTNKDEITIVHFWAPWCENCKAELKNGGWRNFMEVNREVNVIFITTWNDDDGKAELAKTGVTEEPNFKLLHHPNTSRAKAERMNSFFHVPVDWLPTTWVFKKGQLRYALNYGEVRFSLLQQLVRDANESWERSGTKSVSEIR
ncbi:MAG TPA: thioredoxin domain-containing protein [Opitutaceae bacterium]|nr:thioredoxin domain-containing protein [Opitutaceae bacterium]